MSEPSESRSENLPTESLARRAQGDPRAGFELLNERVAPAVYTWANLHIRPSLRARIDPQDLLQEVTLRAYQRFAEFDPDAASFRAWVFGIAKNVLKRALRDLSSPSGSHDALETHEAAQLRDTATSITRRVARAEELAAFHASLEGLPEQDRQLLLFRGLEGLPHERVAALLGLTTEAATKRWHRLRERLQERGREWVVP